jgi:hypothetical protein
MTVYAGTAGGVFKSTDGGANWSLTGLTVDVSSLAVAPPPDAAEPATLFASTADGNVFKSTNGGQTWDWILSTSWYLGVSSGILDLAIDPLSPTVLAVATPMVTGWFEDGSGYTVEGALLWSADGGTNWNLLFGQSHPFSCLAGCDDALWSTTFSAVALTPRTDPNAPVTLYAAQKSGAVFALGADWSSSSLAGVAKLAIDPRTPTTLYACTSAGVYRNGDRSATWNATGLTGVGVFSVAIDPQTPTTLYAATQGGAVFKSQDGGTSWSATGLTGVDVYSLAINPQAPSTLYAATGTGVFRSVDGGATWSATGVITWSQIASVTVDPATVTAGTDSTGTVTLSDPAPAGGAVVALSSSDPWAAAIPTSVTVPAGSTSANFTVFTNSATDSITVTFWGVYAGFISSAALTVTGATLSVSLTPTSVIAGSTSTGTVTVSPAAPTSGFTVWLSSSNPAVAAVPAKAVVEAGATSASFTIFTTAVTASTTVTINANLNGAIKSAPLSVNPAVTLASLGLSPTAVTGQSPSIGTAILSAAAPPGGAVIVLARSDAAVAAVPTAVTIPAGATTTTFTISTNPVATSAAVTISGTYSGVTRAAVLTVNPPTVSSLSLNPTSVTGGASSIGTVILSGPAPAGGAVVVLSSSDPAVATVSSSVTIAGGSTSTTFTVCTRACASATVTISAAYGGAGRSAALTVTVTSDTVVIQAADYFRKRQVLRVDATSTISTAVLSVHETLSGAFIGTLTRYDGSGYHGDFTWPLNPRNITVRSTLCGSAATDVALK